MNIVAIIIVVLFLLFGLLSYINEAIFEWAKNLAEEKNKKIWQKDYKNWESRKNEFEKNEQERVTKELIEWDKQIEIKYLEELKVINQTYQNNLEKNNLANKKTEEECQRENINAKENYKLELARVNNLIDEQERNIDSLKEGYLSGNYECFLKYNELVLVCISKSSDFPTNYEIDYVPETKTLLINYELPTPDHISTLKEVRFIKSKSELKEFHISQSEQKRLYDSVIYQLVLSVISLLFRKDEINFVNSIVLNGWVSFIDKSTGHQSNSCIVSLQTSKEEFQQINLHNVDPKECFKKLKGVSASQLYNIVPIPPIMKINRDDKRFIEAYDVAYKLDDSVNLASMDWEDFEHLVREIFSKRFSKSGGEVKVTQSSRDKGVDAIAFDPDPISGGKIVIQAKRYNNVVGVSAVRDLYGTVMNEGANKGILVTTSNFGQDSYEFARGKPLTLISGGELLTLLAEYGYKARIDLKETKFLTDEN